MTRIASLLLLLLLTACTEIARSASDAFDLLPEAQAQPFPAGNAPLYSSPLMPMGHSSAVATTNSALLTRAGATHTDERNAWLLRWDDLLVVQCQLEACICFSMEDQIAIVTMGSGTTCGEMADTGTPADGQGVCFRVPEGGRRDVRIRRSPWFGELPMVAGSKPGYADSYCSQAHDTTRDPRAGGNFGAPCRAANDCVTSGGSDGTCTVGPDKIVGTYLLHEAASATDCSFEVER